MTSASQVQLPEPTSQGVSPRSVLVTGGARGIGLATARAFLARGDRVYIGDVDEERGRIAQEELATEGEAHFVPLDVTSTSSVRSAFAALGADATLDVVVSNAGIVGPVRSRIATDDDWQHVIDLNLGGSIRVVRESFPYLRRSASPAIVFISSVTAHRGFPGRLAYTASKAALEAAARVLAVEWGVFGIRVNSVAPGFVLTEQAQSIIATGAADPVERARRTALGRMGRPSEIAEAIVWVASPAASYMTGQTLVVDGGFLADGRTGADIHAEPAPHDDPSTTEVAS
jgi:NAD(P)-dependent dehydrogenase (short-subunit alcohol dehydrogenase family)